MTDNAMGFSIDTAEIRNIKCPQNSGRCQIMIYGYHNVGDTPIPDNNLPWAHPIHNNVPALNKIGSSTKYLPGSTVLVITVGPKERGIHFILGAIHRAGVSIS